MQSAIRCTNLSRIFDTTVAVTDLNLEVNEGEFVALLGPSGCGKTTTLRLIAGFERPDSGEIVIGDRPVVSASVYVTPERRRVGMVFQEYALFPHMTVEKNVGYGLNGRASSKKQISEVLELVGLEGLNDRMPHELSGGQQQRVALARALAPEPEILLLDEPFSSIDATLRSRLRLEVRDILRQAGATAIFVTHDQDEALSLADQVAVMEQGTIVQIAPPNVLYRLPATREIAAFVGEANFVPGRANGSSVKCGIGKLPLPLCRPAKGRVEVMLRPEWITIENSQDGEATVTSQAYFGHDQLVTVQTDDGLTLQVRLGPYETVQTGDRVALSVQGMVVAYPQS